MKRKKWHGVSEGGDGRPCWDTWLWLATDGEVVAAHDMPPGGLDTWFGFPANPPLTPADARLIVRELCDEGRDGRWRYRSDPRTQRDLWTQFAADVTATAKRRT